MWYAGMVVGKVRERSSGATPGEADGKSTRSNIGLDQQQMQTKPAPKAVARHPAGECRCNAGDKVLNLIKLLGRNPSIHLTQAGQQKRKRRAVEPENKDKCDKLVGEYKSKYFQVSAKKLGTTNRLVDKRWFD